MTMMRSYYIVMTTIADTALAPRNLLIILSDEHNPDVLGCRNHPEVQTPHLDALARGGTLYANASCASPICVPARAALATGRHLYEAGYWDNVDAYDGRIPSWHHVLRAAGHEVVSIGKLHYRGWPTDDYGFSESLLPMHIHAGRGEPKMLLRDPPADLGDGAGLLASAGPGWSSYNRYDQDVCAEACRWLVDHRAHAIPDRPWVLMVSLVAPHFPLTVPQPYFDLYHKRPLRLPKNYQWGVQDRGHPFLDDYARITGYNRHFRDETDVRRALAAYYGLVSFLDAHVGELLRVLSETGMQAQTRVLYLSDHGEHLGAHGLWGKGSMYRESVGIPMILRGEGVVAGKVQLAATSQVDVYQTVLDAVGVPRALGTASPRARSLFDAPDDARVTLSEYHTVGARSGVFMVRDRRVKYVHPVGLPAQLFDLEQDPEERQNLATQPSHATLAERWHQTLLGFCDPQEVDLRAKERQRQLIQLHGGETAIRAAPRMGGYTPTPQTGNTRSAA